MQNRGNEFLEQLGRVLNWREIESVLKAVSGNMSRRQSIQLLKVMILEHCHGLSDNQCRRLLAHRKAWRQFVGLSSSRGIPSIAVLRSFRNELKEKDLHLQLLELCQRQLKENGLALRPGPVGEAALVPFEKGSLFFGSAHKTKEGVPKVSKTQLPGPVAGK